jgi:hypothetical protein
MQARCQTIDESGWSPASTRARRQRRRAERPQTRPESRALRGDRQAHEPLFVQLGDAERRAVLERLQRYGTLGWTPSIVRIRKDHRAHLQRLHPEVNFAFTGLSASARPGVHVDDQVAWRIQIAHWAPVAMSVPVCCARSGHTTFRIFPEHPWHQIAPLSGCRGRKRPAICNRRRAEAQARSETPNRTQCALRKCARLTRSEFRAYAHTLRKRHEQTEFARKQSCLGKVRGSVPHPESLADVSRSIPRKHSEPRSQISSQIKRPQQR